MKPRREDIRSMVIALMAVVAGVRRASQKGDAAILSVLGAVVARPHVRPSEIAAELVVNQSSVTRHLQKFERLGLVTLVADPDDRRSCRILLTASGHHELRRLTNVGLDRFAQFVRDWDARDVRTLTRLLSNFERSKSAATGKPTLTLSWRTHKSKRS